MDIVFLVPRAGQGLAADVHLATTYAQRRAHSQTQQGPSPGVASKTSGPHSFILRVRTSASVETAEPTLKFAVSRQTSRVRYNPYQGYRRAHCADFDIIGKNAQVHSLDSPPPEVPAAASTLAAASSPKLGSVGMMESGPACPLSISAGLLAAAQVAVCQHDGNGEVQFLQSKVRGHAPLNFPFVPFLAV